MSAALPLNQAEAVQGDSVDNNNRIIEEGHLHF
jgi:hypothetical protein